MRFSALNDVRIVDLTHHIAGPYATRILAGLGADVIKVEPPWGENGRPAGPNGNVGDGPDAKDPRAARFAFLNTDKRSVTLNLKHEAGRKALVRLLWEADLLFENFSPGTLERLGLAPADLISGSPKLSVVSISNFGQDGPDREGRLNDITLFARGGWTYPVGEPYREPLTPPGSLAQYIGGLYAAVGGLQALFARAALGHGQHVDVSLLEATAATMIYESVAFQYTGIVRKRTGRRYTVGPFLIATLRCRDGYAGLHCVTQKQFEALCDLMGAPALARDPRFLTPLKRMENSDALLEIVTPFFLDHDAGFLYREGQRRAIPIVPIQSLKDVLDWEQTRARDYFETIDDPVLGRIRVPGAALRLSSEEPRPSASAPRLGEHNREVLSGSLGMSGADLVALKEAGTI